MFKPKHSRETTPLVDMCCVRIVKPRKIAHKLTFSDLDKKMTVRYIIPQSVINLYNAQIHIACSKALDDTSTSTCQLNANQQLKHSNSKLNRHASTQLYASLQGH